MRRALLLAPVVGALAVGLFFALKPASSAGQDKPAPNGPTPLTASQLPVAQAGG